MKIGDYSFDMEIDEENKLFISNWLFELLKIKHIF